MLSIPCQTGKIVVDNGAIAIVRFNKTLWQAPLVSVIGLTTAPDMLMALKVTISTNGYGNYLAEMVTKGNFKKLQAEFPHVQAQMIGPEWYYDPTALTHVATYTSEKAMQHEIEMAYQHGWQIQGQSVVGSHVNVGRTAGKLLFTGGLGLLTGVSRSKDKTTITFVRTADWMQKQSR